jgi:hypothetical protein
LARTHFNNERKSTPERFTFKSQTGRTGGPKREDRIKNSFEDRTILEEDDEGVQKSISELNVSHRNAEKRQRAKGKQQWD